ncbi:MAG: rhodanese-like domain-containing protein [Rhodospirillales bacterium]|nr:rhodanese-like domain-containing protein [Rhodospirillales bacterium]MBL8999062.1 rhodanese-like domain-containing protein [Gemmatimonadota bacterium]
MTVRSIPKALLFAFSFALFAVAPALAQDAPMSIDGAKTVNAQQVIELIEKNPGIVILDNRQPADFGAGHIEGAVRLLDTDTNAQSLAAHIKSKDDMVLFYCNGLKCGRAAKAAKVAIDLGYRKVHYYALGMDEWRAAGLPLVK